MKHTYSKRTYICDYDTCDTLIEITSRDILIWRTNPVWCLVCGKDMILTQIDNATTD